MKPLLAIAPCLLALGGLLAQTTPPPLPTATPAPVAAAPPAAAPAESEPEIPQAFPRERYQESWKKNPFLLKTAPVIQQKESWAKDYALTSLAEIGGVFRVSIKNKVTGKSERLQQGKENKEGFSIVTVNLQPDRKSSSVDVTKDGEQATLTYDLAATAAAAARPAIPGQPGMPRGAPVVPGQPGVAPAAGGIRTTATGQPGAAGMMAASPPTQPGGYQRPVAGAAYTGGAPAYAGGAGVRPGYVAAPRTAAGVATPSAVGTARTTTTTAAGMPAATTTTATRTGNFNATLPTATTTTAAGATAAPATTVDANGNVIVDPNSPTPVTRRRTLIPAPVINQ